MQTAPLMNTHMAGCPEGVSPRHQTARRAAAPAISLHSVGSAPYESPRCVIFSCFTNGRVNGLHPSAPTFQHTFSHQRGLHSTPQLSSGPSGNDSSPGSYPHSLASTSGAAPVPAGGSVLSSRAASPPLWAQAPPVAKTTPLRAAAANASRSMPASRASSPPITLPPLRMGSPADADGNGEEDERGKDREKVALPGFSDVEAVAGVRFEHS